MTARPTPERLVDIRARHDHAMRILLVGGDKLDAGERRGVADMAALLAEVDALQETIYAMDRELESGHAAMIELDEARAILADLYAMAEVELVAWTSISARDRDLRKAVLERCRPKGES